MVDIAKYHRRYLETAAGENSNNARWPKDPNKGLKECLKFGLIEKLRHPDADYFYYVITPAGKEALATPITKKARAKPRLTSLPPLVASLPDRFGKTR